jgi:hypothetical protein
MRWKITIEGMDECDGRDTAEIVIEKEFDRLSKGEIGLSISDGKTIMACLQQLAVNGRRGEVVIGEERLSPRSLPRRTGAVGNHSATWSSIAGCESASARDPSGERKFSCLPRRSASVPHAEYHSRIISAPALTAAGASALKDPLFRRLSADEMSLV